MQNQNDLRTRVRDKPEPEPGTRVQRWLGRPTRGAKKEKGWKEG